MTLDAQLISHNPHDDESLTNEPQALQAPSEPESFSAFVDPSRSLEAARRMEANCRIGLRFFSDFRRVKPLDSLTPEDDDLIEVGDDVFELDNTDRRDGLRFDPMFARR